MSVREFDVELPDGRILHGYDTGTSGRPVLWQHGTPNTGQPPVPLAAASAELGLRWFSLDRPGYGGSTPRPGRTLADVAADAASLADHLGLGRFSVAGHSGGASHALAVAAALPDRVEAVLAVSAVAPPALLPGDAWFAGMGPVGTATLRSAREGRAAREAYGEAAGDGIDFTAGDWATLEGEWGWLGQVAGSGQANGPGPAVDDDLAYVADWGVDVATITVPVHLLHGSDDLIAPVTHARRLAEVLVGSDLRVVDGAGHISVLDEAVSTLRRFRTSLEV